MDRLYGVLLLALLLPNAVYSRNVDSTIRREKRTSEQSCDVVRSFFRTRNIPLRQEDSGIAGSNSPKGSICGGQCCGAEAEAVLRKQGQEVFATMLRHNSMTLQGLLNSTATTLQNHIIELTHQSENKTLLLFSQVYRRKAALSKDAIHDLYLDIRRFISINSSQDAFSNSNIDIMASVMRFFSDIFPVAFHNVVDSLKQDFSFEYKQCLKSRIADILPFGDIPKQVQQSLSKSLDATRQLLQAFNVGIEVLNATDTLIIEDNDKSNSECHDALMKMTYCPKCVGFGHDTKPCSGYCLNVLRGCLTRYVAELDSPWNGYVEGVERLVTAMRQSNNEAGVSADAVIRGLDTRISEAIMYVMEKTNDMETKVKRACGAYKMSTKEDPLMAEVEASGEPGAVAKQRMIARGQQFSLAPDGEMLHFLNAIGKSRGFYGNLADSLCQDENFAEPKDQHCWNGERIGEYTKTVVDAGLDMQKYNPEVKQSTSLTNGDTRVASFADKLRHVHQLVMSSLGAIGPLQSDNYMQGDGADGSGSGVGSDFDDDDDLVRGSGSGNGPYEPKEPGVGINPNPIDDNKIERKASSSPISIPSATLAVLLLLLGRFLTMHS